MLGTASHGRRAAEQRAHISLYLPCIPYLPYISPISPLYLQGEPQNSGPMWQHELMRATTVGAAADTQPEAARVQAAHLYLPYISPTSPLNLPRPSAPWRGSPISPLYLPRPSTP